MKEQLNYALRLQYEGVYGEIEYYEDLLSKTTELEEQSVIQNKLTQLRQQEATLLDEINKLSQ